MRFKEKWTKPIIVSIVYIVLIFLFYADIFRVPILLIVLAYTFSKKIRMAINKIGQHTSDDATPQPQDFPAKESMCDTSDTQDEFCHNEHQAQRLSADAAYSELQELESLLKSGLMEKAEYNQRVAEIMAVLK